MKCCFLWLYPLKNKMFALFNPKSFKLEKKEEERNNRNRKKLLAADSHVTTPLIVGFKIFSQILWKSIKFNLYSSWKGLRAPLTMQGLHQFYPTNGKQLVLTKTNDDLGDNLLLDYDYWQTLILKLQTSKTDTINFRNFYKDLHNLVTI